MCRTVLRLTTATAFTCALLALGLPACGGDEPDHALTAEQALDGYFASQCATYHRCRSSFPPGDALFVRFYGADEAACVELSKEELDAHLIIASIEAGRVRYDAGRARVCIDSPRWTSTTCEALWSPDDDDYTPPPECEEAFSGTLEEGDACTHAFDCVGAGAFCGVMGTCVR
ncbi:MAG: hypothetical protein KF901_22700 [Myxococcales bacterium]|nr:hypothetical protein [Myxococcales bacterium]